VHWVARGDRGKSNSEYRPNERRQVAGGRDGRPNVPTREEPEQCGSDALRHAAKVDYTSQLVGRNADFVPV
jgi:hypothetical protein